MANVCRFTKEEKEEFGRRIREAREGRGLARSEIVKAFNESANNGIRISNMDLYRWEKGIHYPSKIYIDRLADLIGVNPSYLKDLNESNPNSSGGMYAPLYEINGQMHSPVDLNNRQFDRYKKILRALGVQYEVLPGDVAIFHFDDLLEIRVDNFIKDFSFNVSALLSMLLELVKIHACAHGENISIYPKDAKLFYGDYLGVQDFNKVWFDFDGAGRADPLEHVNVEEIENKQIKADIIQIKEIEKKIMEQQ